MPAPRTLVTVVAALCCLLSSVSAAEAARLGWGNGRGIATGYAGIDEFDQAIVGAVEGAGPGSAPLETSGPSSGCRWVSSLQAADQALDLRPESIGLVGVERADGDGARLRLFAWVCAGRVTRWQWLRLADRGVAAISVSEEVHRRLPTPQGRFSPNLPAAPAIVHVPVWFAVPGQWSPVQVSAVIPGAALTVTATPTVLRFEPGDGGRSASCAGPGAIYEAGAPEPQRPPACSYAYPNASSIAPNGVWPARLLIDWEVTWVSSDGQTGALPPMTTTADVPVAVREIQAIERAR